MANRYGIVQRNAEGALPTAKVVHVRAKRAHAVEENVKAWRAAQASRLATLANVNASKVTTAQHTVMGLAMLKAGLLASVEAKAAEASHALAKLNGEE